MIKIEGNKALIDKLDKLTKEAEEVLVAEIADAVEVIETAAKKEAPNDLSFLVNSIVGDSKDLIGEVRAGADYAAYIEFGTGSSVDVPSGLEDYAIKFKGKDIKQVNLPARPYLFPAFFAEVPKLIDRIETQIGKKL